MTLQEAKEFVIETIGKEKAVIWWEMKNPMLGGISPNVLLQMGREQKLLQWIECCKDENRG